MQSRLLKRLKHCHPRVMFIISFFIDNSILIFVSFVFLDVIYPDSKQHKRYVLRN